MARPVLLSAPNVSEGRDAHVIAAIVDAFSGPSVRMLDVHSDADHHRSVITLAGEPGRLAGALAAGAREAVARIDLDAPRGEHPHVGAIDVVPIIHLDPGHRGAACAEALVTADRLGELGLPVFVYGELGAGRRRADLRRGGRQGLARRLEAGDLRPDFGPARLHPSAGAVLVAARPPLLAFNLELAAPATLDVAQAIARAIRDGGPEGLPGVRAIGVALTARDRATSAREHTAGGRAGGLEVAQVSTNVEDPEAVPLARVLAAVRRHAPVASVEVVGLTPRSALVGFPDDVPMPGFDPSRHVLENALGL